MIAAGAPSIDDVREAAATLAGRVHRTPVFTSASLAEVIGAPVVLKAELLQRTGAFKIRGALNRIDRLSPDERERGVITVSAGNHAAAVGLAARLAGTDALVLMFQGASEVKAAAARGYGATVDLDSADAAEAFERMREIGAQTGRVVVHPFDDPYVIAGQGTVGLQLTEQLEDLDVVVVPVGGGGLISGVAIAVKERWPDARVVAVQAETTGTLAASLDAGHPVRVRQRPTIADALAPPAVGELCLAICRALVDAVVHVSEDELAAAMRFVYARAKLACEPGAAAPVAALLAGRVEHRGGPVAAVLSGGNVSPDVTAAVLGGAPLS